MAGVKTWSRTASSNVLANIGYTLDENMAPSAVNDSMRAVLADIKSEWSQATAVASASTPDITIATSGAGTTSGGYLHITGTTTITGFATADAGIRRRVVFDAALQLTHNATSFILLTGANITTAAGDCAEFVSEGSGNWRMTGYERASGAALTATADSMIILREEQTSGTNGGTFTSGAWQTRTLNTEAVDTGSLCSLSSNQFTLSAGTYRIRASAPGYACAAHQAKLYNTTDAADVILGTTEFAAVGGGVQNRSIVEGRFTISGSKTFELRHRCATTSSTFGFGNASSFSTEVYSIVELHKE